LIIVFNNFRTIRLSSATRIFFLCAEEEEEEEGEEGRGEEGEAKRERVPEEGKGEVGEDWDPEGEEGVDWTGLGLEEREEGEVPRWELLLLPSGVFGIRRLNSLIWDCRGEYRLPFPPPSPHGPVALPPAVPRRDSEEFLPRRGR
jgi:hypothetical protein